MSGITRMIVDDPSKFPLLTADMKKQVIKGATATVNVMAAIARKEAVKNIKSNFTTRNTFTQKMVQFTPMAESPYIKLKAIQSFVGIASGASYMARQEEGGEHTPRQGSKLAIPTDTARGGSFKNRVQRARQVKDIRKKSRRVHGSPSVKRTKKSQLIARAYIAHKYNLFLPMGWDGEERNVHTVLNFKARGKKEGREAEFDTDMVYNFKYAKTLTKAKPWLLPACEKAAKDIEKIFISQMKKLGM